MSTKKILTKNSKIDYKLKFKALEKDFAKLQAENLLLKSFNQPSYEDKVKILDDYYNWLSEDDTDANYAVTLVKYKKELKKREVRQ